MTTNFYGCNKTTCDDYPSIEKGQAILNEICKMCVHYKRFDLFLERKKKEEKECKQKSEKDVDLIIKQSEEKANDKSK